MRAAAAFFSLVDLPPMPPIERIWSEIISCGVLRFMDEEEGADKLLTLVALLVVVVVL